MNIELSVTNEIDLNDALSMDVDAINFGNEGCGYRIPDAEKILEILKNIEAHGKTPRLTLPFITQRFYERTMGIMQKIGSTRANTIITINDYGILYAAAKEPWSENIEWVTGRHLGGSFGQVPWHEHVLRDEDPSIQKQMKSHALTNKTILEFLKVYGVIGIEGNALVDELKSLGNVKADGFTIYIRAEYSPVFTGNVCTTSLYLQKPPPACSAFCDEVLMLELADILTIQGESVNRPDWVEKVPAFYAHGNMLYHYTPLALHGEDFVIIDYLSFEMRNYQKNKLAEKIRTFKNLTGT